MHAVNAPRSVLELNDLLRKSPQIAIACAAVENCLSESKEHIRPFFERSFPLLLSKLFGFDNSSSAVGGWLYICAQPGREADARAVTSLLSPRSILFRSLLEADREALVKFVFPHEHLPPYVQLLLSTEQGAQLLSQQPHLRDRVVKTNGGRCQVHVGVFEYYMFWFAYYARRARSASAGSQTLRSSSNQLASGSSGLGVGSLQSTSRYLGQLARTSLHAGGVDPNTSSKSQPSSPYKALLQSYLRHFLPHDQRTNTSTPSPQVASPAATFDRSNSSSSSSSTSTHGEVVLYALIDYWLKWDEPPFPPACLDDASALIDYASLYSYQVPGSQLLEASTVLTQYINSNPSLSSAASSASSSGQQSPSHRSCVFKTPHGRSTPNMSLPWPNAAVQQPAYRFFHRTFAMWPADASHASQVVKLWLMYLQPWNATSTSDSDQQPTRSSSYPAPVLSAAGSQLKHFAHVLGERAHLVPNTTSSSQKQQQQQQQQQQAQSSSVQKFSAAWQGYVLANYLSYTELLRKFVELCCKRVLYSTESTLAALAEVFKLFQENQQLLQLLEDVESVYNACPTPSNPPPATRYRDAVRLIYTQLMEWELGQTHMDALIASAAGTSAVSSPHTPTGMLSPVPATPRLRTYTTQALDSVPRLLSVLLLRLEQESRQGNVAVSDKLLKSLEKLRPEQTYVKPPAASASGAEVASPSSQSVMGLQRHSWQDVRYKGDWLLRPIETNEIAWLVRILVPISVWINDIIGLGRPVDEQRCQRVGNVVVRAACVVHTALMRWLNKHHVRVNLRPLAEWQTLAFITLLTMVYYSVKWLWLQIASAL
eukprot:jgi/Chlat1/4159/Chrsp27S04264